MSVAGRGNRTPGRPWIDVDEHYECMSFAKVRCDLRRSSDNIRRRERAVGEPAIPCWRSMTTSAVVGVSNEICVMTF